MIHKLVMWSGGIDSTYKLAFLLKETTEKIHVHHVYINNREGRVILEAEAIKKLFPKLQAIRTFTFSESTVDHRQYSHIPYDMAVVCFEAGACARDHTFVEGKERITHWTIGTHQSEGHWQRRFDAIEPIVGGVCFPHDAPKFDLGRMPPKGEEIEYLRALNLFDDCFYCRMPVDGKACGKCPTCKEVAG